MKEDELKSLMKGTRPPDPYPVARRAAMAAAQQAFREKMQEPADLSQGSPVENRPDGEAAIQAVIANRETKMQKWMNFRMPAVTLAVLGIVGSVSWLALSGYQPETMARPVANGAPAADSLQVDAAQTTNPADQSVAESQIAAAMVPAAPPASNASPIIDQNKSVNPGRMEEAAQSSNLPTPVGQSVGLADAAPAEKKSEQYALRGDVDQLKEVTQPQIAPEMKTMAAPAAPGMMDGAVAMNSLAMVGDQAPGYYHDAGRDKFEAVSDNPIKEVAQEPVSTFSVDVDTASYSFMRRSLNEGHLPQKDTVRIEEMINYFDYNYKLPDDRTQPFRPSVTMMPAPWNAQHLLMHVGIKGYDLPVGARPKANLVFLIDVSGSMDEPTKLPLAKNALKMLVDTLKPDDTVAIVTYAGTTGVALTPTAISDKRKIVQVIDSLQAGGGTAGAAGLQMAYNLADNGFIKEGVNRVILATDGDFNVGITDQNELKSAIERERDKGVYLSVLGFGMGNYNDALMQTLAQNGNGNAAYIDSLNEARRVLVEEAQSTLFPIGKDVKIQIEFNPKMVGEYRLIGYETRMLAREDFNNDKVDAGDVGAGHAVTALYEITPKSESSMAVDPLRYAEAKSIAVNATGGSEYAFVKIRYKLPNENVSKLIERPVTVEDKVGDASKATDDVRFAASVAAFGQLLRGGKYIGSLSYDDIISLADGARGNDAFGQRSEFVNLVRLAKTLQGGSAQ